MSVLTGLILVANKIASYDSLTSPKEKKKKKKTCASESIGDLSYVTVHRLPKNKDKDKTVWLVISLRAEMKDNLM